MSRLYSIKENYFQKWSPNMAYILGMWWADGCLESKYRASITLHKNDENLLNQIRSEMGIDKPFYFIKNTLKLDMASIKLTKDIIDIGGKFRKSKNMGMPKNLPEDLAKDFIRGLFDGDGSVWKTKTRNHLEYLGEITSGDKIFLINIDELLKQKISDLKTYMIEKRCIKRNKKCLNYGLRFSCNNLRKVRDFMYKDNPDLKMTRKYRILQEMGKVKIPLNSFDRGRDIARELKISTAKEWQNYVAKNPSCLLPVRPDRVYKNKGWINWKNWLRA